MYKNWFIQYAANPDCVRPLIPCLLKSIESEDDSFPDQVHSVLTLSAQAQPEVFEEHVPQLLELTVENKNWEFASKSAKHPNTDRFLQK